MNLHTELMRIAETVDRKEDKEILMAAAIKLLPMPEPKSEHLTKVDGFGYCYSRLD